MAQLLHAVGELDLVVAAGGGVREDIEDRRGQHVAPHDGVVRKALVHGRLLIHVAYAVYAVGELLFELDGRVLAYLLVGELPDGDGAAVVRLGSVDKLLEHRRLAEHYIVAQQYAEGLVADEALRAPYRVAQTLCLLLAQEIHVRHVRDLAHRTGFFFLAV